MTVFARLRSSSRGILVWMLLAAYACTPLAAWAQPRQQAVVVPYCTGQGPGKAGTRWPRRIVLRFASHSQVSSSAVPFALPATRRHALDPMRTAAFDATRRPEPVVAPALTWRPPPRAPPGLPAQV
jgi:hypothetical protein